MKSNYKLMSRKSIALLFIYRVCTTLLFPSRTYFDPDEHWQGTEVSQCLAGVHRDTDGDNKWLTIKEVVQSNIPGNAVEDRIPCALTWEWTRGFLPGGRDLEGLGFGGGRSLPTRPQATGRRDPAWLHDPQPIRPALPVFVPFLFYRLYRRVLSLFFIGPFRPLPSTEAYLLSRVVPSVALAFTVMVPIDISVYHIAHAAYGPYAAAWALFASLTGWFVVYGVGRPFANSYEAAMLAASLALLGKLIFGRDKDVVATAFITWREIVALLLGGAAVWIRCNLTAVWIPLGLYLVYLRGRGSLVRAMLYFFVYIVCALLGMAVSFLIDRIVYGIYVLPPPQVGSFVFNVVEDRASAYGTHSHHWYFTAALPAILGVWVVPCAGAVKRCFSSSSSASYRQNTGKLTGLVVVYVSVYSLSAHKEFRYISPVLPPCLAICGAGLANFFQQNANEMANTRISISKLKNRSVIAVLSVSLFLNIVPLLYLCIVHQRAPIAVTEYIVDAMVSSPLLQNTAITSERSTKFSVHYLLPCHSTPAYAHLRIPGTLPTILTLDCSPACRTIPEEMCEEEQFYKDPQGFAEALYVNVLPKIRGKSASDCMNPEYDQDNDYHGGGGDCATVRFQSHEVSPVDHIPDFVVVSSEVAQNVAPVLVEMGLYEAHSHIHAIKNIEWVNSNEEGDDVTGSGYLWLPLQFRLERYVIFRRKDNS